MVRETSLSTFYTSLRTSTLRSTTSPTPTPLLIFPSTSDADSLCSLKILFHILESDSIPYACYPVSSFSSIHSYLLPTLSLSPSHPPPLTLLFLNWGSHKDIKKILNLPTSTHIFILDSHRPIHLHNLSKHNTQVTTLFTKDDEIQSDLSYDFDLETLANACVANGGDNDYEEDDDEMSDSEEEEDDDDEERKKKRRVEDEDEENPERVFKKLKRSYYKMGTYHGKASGVVMYELAHILRKNNNELLWLACVALTDQFVHERLTAERYQAGVMELEQHVNSMGNLDVVTSVVLRDGTKIRAPDVSRIVYEDEPRLMLLREWSLFDSMLCSSYVATKMKTWSENGMKKVGLMLARMGFALVECKQKWRYMSVEVKKRMKGEFERFLPEYGLSEFYYRGFVRCHGYSSRVSAADVVYGVTALLEGGGGGERGFGVAYDALSLSNLEVLREGMQSAIKVQRAIVRQGSMAITKRGSVRSGRKFRWVKLEDSADVKLLGYPQALTKFCYFVMDALREKGARMKPLLCACLSQEQGKVLIVGVTGKPRLGAVQGNAFGLAFKNAAQEIGGEYFHELFESSWIVLDRVAVNSFMVRLTEQL